MFKQIGYKFQLNALTRFIKYCKYFKKQKISTNRFKFIIKNNIKFNYNIIINIL